MQGASASLRTEDEAVQTIGRVRLFPQAWFFCWQWGFSFHLDTIPCTTKRKSRDRSGAP